MNYKKGILGVSFCSCLLLLMGCIKEMKEPIREEAWFPIYESVTKTKEIKSVAARQPQFGGKIYAWEDYLFQLEPNQGIHIYQLKDKKINPYGFIQVYGAQEIAIRNRVLYTNNFNDIISLDIQDLKNVSVLGRVENVFEIKESALPPEMGYFECVDPNKGRVVGWELKKNVNVKCRY